MTIAAATCHSPSRSLREIGRYAVILREWQYWLPFRLRRRLERPEGRFDAMIANLNAMKEEQAARWTISNAMAAAGGIAGT